MEVTLLKKIHSRSASVAVISPLSQIRLPILKVLKKNGLRKIAIYKSIEDFQKLDKQQSEWIITQLFSGKASNALHYTRQYHDELLKNGHRISFVISKEEEQAIPEAFSFGIISWFSIESGLETITGFEEQIEDFFNQIRIFIEIENAEALLAAHYLRMYFKKEKMWLELLQLEKSLCQKFPAQKSCTINLVEAFFLAGEYKEGRIKFEETKAMFPGLLDDDIKRINQMFPNALISEEKFAQRYNISNVVVVEGDQAEMTKVESALQRLGVEQFLAFTTYKEAWEYLKNADEPDLIIMEWTKKTKDLSREQFAQRVRSKGFIQVPLVIMLSHLKPFESNLINDIKAIQIIKKPLREKDLLMSLAYAIQQYRSPDERKPVEYKIEQSIKAGNLSFAYYLRKKLLRNPNVSLPRKYFIESLFYFYNGQYEKCRSLLIKGIKLSVGDKKSGADVKPNLDKTVLLAKCLFQLGDKELAIQMMEKARDRSPFNIDLLIHLVHMNYEFGNSEGVQESLEKAEAIDRDNTQVVNAKAKMALYNGNIKHAHEMMAASENLTDIIGSLNNQAVKSIRNGDFEKGIQLYQSAIKALPIKEFDYLGVVHYNLALAYLRKDLPEAGLNYLRQVLNYPQSRVFQKANSLLSRAEKSVADNRPTSQLLGAKVSANTEEQTDLNIIISELNESSTAYGLSGIHVPDRRSDYSQKLLTTGDVSFSRKNLPSSLNVESGPSSKKAG